MRLLHAAAPTLAEAHCQDQSVSEVSDIPDDWIVSYAHDWRGGVDNRVICMRCKAETQIGQWDVPRCIKHYEHANCGYEDESEK